MTADSPSSLAEAIDLYLGSVVSITPGARRLLERAAQTLRSIHGECVAETPSLPCATPERLCSFCENRAATVGKYCPKCAQLADDALDEIAGGPGEFKKMLAKHLAKGTRQ